MKKLDWRPETRVPYLKSVSDGNPIREWHGYKPCHFDTLYIRKLVEVTTIYVPTTYFGILAIEADEENMDNTYMTNTSDRLLN